ncbi:MAG: NAD(P)/FAD-dependent oxidoreductase [Deltaproteobacteria bacterium]|nr:NAD(P)/FAD-dependent oxidoreductase [Deltaproteobacteria bacterium]
MTRYDLCVLGAGPAGLAAAVRAHDLGKTVALVDGGRAGGAGIWDGALSSKTAWHLSGDFARARRTDRGYRGGLVTLAWDEVRDQVRAACDEASALVQRQLAYLAAPSPRGGRVDHIPGRARFIAPDAVEISGPTPRRIDAERFLVAVGSRPRPLPDIAIDGERILTSDHVDHLAAPPASLAIIGGGVVGCEYATIFGQFGATAVELLDRQPRILPSEDDDVASVIAARFAALGIAIHRQARLEAIAVTGDGVDLTIRAATDGGGEAIIQRRVARVLVAIGRVPDTAALGLDAAGVRTTASGAIVVDGTRSTSPRVWAAGDVTADIMLVNMAEIEARHAVADMFGLDPPPISYDAQSAIYFLSPELASVGLGEHAARQKGIPFRAAVISNRLLRRSIAMRATDGFVKLLAHRDGRLLGLRVVGPQACSCIQGVALLIAGGGTLDDLDRCVHPHPAITEGVQEAARLLLGNSLYKPGAVGDLARIVEG